jgi:hypothetical protein
LKLSIVQYIIIFESKGLVALVNHFNPQYIFNDNIL